MERARVVWLAAIAFFAGAFVSALAFSAGSPIASLGREPVSLSIAIENVGTHNATARLHVAQPFGATIAQWSFELAAGDARRFTQPRLPDEGLLVRATVSWDERLYYERGGPADAQVGLDPAACASGAVYEVTFVVDTTHGVSYDEASASCEA